MENPGRHIISGSRVSLPWRIWFCYGVGHVLNDICASMWFTYLIVFFHFVLNFDSVSSGIILLIGQIADALFTPFVGIESDKNNNNCLCRFGRRKSWHLFGTICVICSFPFIFTPCMGCQDAHTYAQMVYFSLFVIIFQFGWAAVQISHLALIPELTPNDNQRTQLTTIRYGFTVISTILVYIITWISLNTGKDGSDSKIGPNDAFKFQKVVYIGLVIGLIMSLIFYWGIKEDSGFENKRRERNHKTVFQFMKAINFYQVAIVYMTSRLFVNLVQINIPLYLHEVLSKNAEILAIVPLLIYIGSVIGSSFVNFLNRILGRKIAYICGSAIGISACVWIKFGKNLDNEIYAISLLLGISGCILTVTSLGLTADLIGFDTDTGAFVYGFMSFVDKLSGGLAVMIIQYIKNYSGSNYYEKVIVFVCGGIAAFGIPPLLALKFTGAKENSQAEPSINEDERKPLL